MPRTYATSAAQGGMTIRFSNNETPSGVIDGSNATFTLANSPSPSSSLQLYLNGQFETQGVGSDYTLSGNTITFSTPPAIQFSGLPFKAFYQY